MSVGESRNSLVGWNVKVFNEEVDEKERRIGRLRCAGDWSCPGIEVRR